MADGAGIAILATSVGGGLTTAPIDITGNQRGNEDAAVNLLMTMARILDDQSVPKENRWFVAPPFSMKMRSKLVLSSQRFR